MIAADGGVIPIAQGVFDLDEFTVIIVRRRLQPAMTGQQLRVQSRIGSDLLKSLKNVTGTLACQKRLLDQLVAAEKATVKAMKDYKALCRNNSMSNKLAKRR
jgi:hypothetical protein